MEESDEESESELIDVNQKAGLDFEKFIVQKFDKKYFAIRNWASDKYVEGRYADTTTQPDIQLSLKLRGASHPDKPFLHKAGIGKYRKKVDSDFFFDQESNSLR